MWTYTIHDIEKCVEDVIWVHFLPALLGRAPPNDLERNLFSLPCPLGAIGIANPARVSDLEYSSSINVTKFLYYDNSGAE
jgi:hypothetical protein